MKIKKSGNIITINSLTINEIQTILKVRGEITLVNFDNEILNIISVDKYGNYSTDNAGKLSYQDLIAFISNSGLKQVEMTTGEFRRLEPLLIVLDKIDGAAVSTCSYIDYNDDIFVMCYKPFSDGGSNKLYYFEDNNTFIFFDENGPNLKTDTKSTTFLDLIS